MNDALAKKRWMIIQMVKMMGIASLLLGVLVISGKLDWPAIVGYLLAANGIFDVFVIPQILVRNWRSPRE